MLALASNHLRTVLHPSDDFARRHGRQPNMSTGATVALVVGGVILVPIVIWAILAAVAVKTVSNAANNFNNIRPNNIPDSPDWPSDFPDSPY